VPATSRAQYRFMQAVAHGGIHRPGLPAAKAREYVAGQRYQTLPAKAVRKKPRRAR